MAGEYPDIELGIVSAGLVNGNRSSRLGDGLFKVAVCLGGDHALQHGY
jgi:hypothetical protein